MTEIAKLTKALESSIQHLTEGLETFVKTPDMTNALILDIQATAVQAIARTIYNEVRDN